MINTESKKSFTYGGGPIFDGDRLRHGCIARFEEGALCEIRTETGSNTTDQAARYIDLEGDILSPGYVDLQVNGGDGIMFNADPSLNTIKRIALAHHRLGVSALLPTLITDTPEITRAAISAGIEAVNEGVPGVAGLHLEGPHLSVARKGAHDAALIRPMNDADLATLLAAATALPTLMVTLAPENATPEQVSTLAKAGVIVSLGHTDANFETCMAYISAGARCATHLFNAMSQLGNREPGLVGAALQSGELSCGLIADGLHVHPASIRAAWQAKSGPGRIFLVSDAMAVAGTEETSFHLGGREILRKGGKLTLQDGTLAGADLDLTTAIRVLVERVGLSLEDALCAATTTPWNMLSTTTPILHREFIRISADLKSCAPL